MVSLISLKKNSFGDCEGRKSQAQQSNHQDDSRCQTLRVNET